MLRNDEVQHQGYKMNTYEYAIKNVWDYVKDHQKLCSYLPTDEIAFGRYPDRRFFWGVAFTVIPRWSTAYLKQVEHERNMERNKIPAARTIRISDKWAASLEQHDFQSKSK